MCRKVQVDAQFFVRNGYGREGVKKFSTRYFFFFSKDLSLPLPHMNRLLQFREIFRYREDIRFQARKSRVRVVKTTRTRNFYFRHPPPHFHIFNLFVAILGM